MSQSLKTKLLIYGFLGALILTFIIPLPSWGRIILIVGFFLIFLYFERSFFYFLIGAKRLEKKDPKCWDWFKRALSAKLPPVQSVFIGTAFVKQGDVEFGNNVCRKIIQRYPNSEVSKKASVTLSMGLWVQGQLDQAIKLLEDLKQKGYKDKTLDINLTTYLLEKGEAEKALKIIAGAEKEGILSHGMLDNKLWALMLQGKFEECHPLVRELMQERTPKFPEAYLHSAQVMIHEGRISKALEYIDSAIDREFSLNAVIRQDYLEKLYQGLSDPKTSKAYAYAIDQNVAKVASGKQIDIDLTQGEDFVFVSEKEVLSKQRQKASSKKQEGEQVNFVDYEDREPNTDLTEEDFVILEAKENSALEEEEEEEEEESLEAESQNEVLDERVPNTDVSNDEDREPNTSLD